MANNNQPHKAPYHFVPVNNTETANRVFTPKNEAATLNSGEIKLRITSLSECIFSQYQTTYGQNKALIDKSTLAPTFTKFFQKEKQLLMPLFYKDSGGEKQIITGSTIKGAIANNVNAITNKQMRQVQEQSFAYRPILSSPNPKKEPAAIKSFPARIIGFEHANGQVVGINVDVYTNAKQEDITYHENHPGGDTFRHLGSTDYYGYLAKLFDLQMKKRKPTKLCCFAELVNFDKLTRKSIKLLISKPIIDRYKQTTNFLKDDKTGHLSNRNPLLVKDNLKKLQYKNGESDNCGTVDINEIKKAIGFNRDFEDWQDEIDEYGSLLIFVEAELDKHGKPEKIISFGNNYRYYWKHEGSIRKAGKLETRKEIFEKERDYEGYVSHISSNLFGYVLDDDNNESVKQAGKVSFNHALENINKNNGVYQKKLFRCLKRLGSPKASSYEFYLKQNKAHSILNDYSDVNTSELAGRKFYLHNQLDYIQNPSDHASILQDANTAIAAYVTPVNTEFHSTLRFKELSNLELAILLVATNPQLLVEAYKSQENEHKCLVLDHLFNNIKHSLAQKLGYAKPYGFGSCQFEIVCLTNNAQKENTLIKYVLPFFEHIIKEFNLNSPNGESYKYLDSLNHWINILQKTPNLQAFYAGHKKADIPKFHSDIRNQQVKSKKLRELPKLDIETLTNFSYRAKT